MRVNRQAFLTQLEAVSPGLAKRELVEQSSCFCFIENGDIVTYNEEVCCRAPGPLQGVTGAVTAAPLLAILSKLAEEEIEVVSTETHLEVRGKSRRAGILKEAEVLLPLDHIELPGQWHKLPADYVDAVKLVQQCAAQSDEDFRLTCVHIAPGWIEACDNFQIARYTCKTGHKQSLLLRVSAAKHIAALGMAEISTTPNWCHYRNPAGLVLSCRRFLDEYPDISAHLEQQGEPMTLPGGLAEAVAKAQIFSSENSEYDNVKLKLKPPGVLELSGEGALGWYREMKKVAYKGPQIECWIAPGLLTEIASKHRDCFISAEQLRVDGGKWQYVASLVVGDAAGAEPVAATAADVPDDGIPF